MGDELALLRRAEQLLDAGERPETIVSVLFRRLRVDRLDATAAVATAVLLREHGLRLRRGI